MLSGLVPYNMEVEKFVLLGRICESPGRITKFYFDEPDRRIYTHRNMRTGEEITSDRRYFYHEHDSYRLMKTTMNRGTKYYTSVENSELPPWNVSSGSRHFLVRLERAGWIERIKDGSCIRLYPTERGIEVYGKWMALAKEVHDTAVSVLGADCCARWAEEDRKKLIGSEEE